MEFKYIFWVVLILGSIQVNAQKVKAISFEQELINFENELNSRVIIPTYKIQVEKDTIQFEGFTISYSSLEEPLKIYINKDTLNISDMLTQNFVEDDIIPVDYSNIISTIHYYAEAKILMFQASFYPCTGLGCGVNFQILYQINTKKVFVFGRFRTGFDMELYNYNDEQIYYLSKSYDGRNIQGIETITYELFPVDFSVSKLNPLKHVFAKSIYDENANKLLKFESKWIKSN